MANVISGDRFDSVPRSELEPIGDPAAGPVREHPELAWQDGPGPTYSRATAEEMLANRYVQLTEIMRRCRGCTMTPAS